MYKRQYIFLNWIFNYLVFRKKYVSLTLWFIVGRFFDIQKQYAIFVKLGASRQDWIFIKTKCKVCLLYGRESLTEHWYIIFSLWRFSIFHQDMLYIHRSAGLWSNSATVSSPHKSECIFLNWMYMLHMQIMVKVHDNTWSTLDLCRVQG